LLSRTYGGALGGSNRPAGIDHRLDASQMVGDVMVDGVASDRPRQGVLEAGRDAEGPVAARGLVSGRDPRTQSRGRDGARSAEGNRGITPAAG